MADRPDKGYVLPLENGGTASVTELVGSRFHVLLSNPDGDKWEQVFTRKEMWDLFALDPHVTVYFHPEHPRQNRVEINGRHLHKLVGVKVEDDLKGRKVTLEMLRVEVRGMPDEEDT